MDESSGIPGKRLLPQLGVGCLLFAALMGFGTYYIGQLMIPGAKKANEEYMRTHPIKDEGTAPVPR